MLALFASGLLYQAIADRSRKSLFSKIMALLPAPPLLLVASFAVGMAPILLVPILGFAILFMCSFCALFLLDKENEPGLSYGSNLLGGGIGGLAAVLLLSFADPYKGLAFCSVVCVSVSLASLDRNKTRAIPILFFVASLLIFFVPVITPGAIWEKWNSFSKVSVFDSMGRESPILWGKSASGTGLPTVLLMNIDSSAATVIVLEPEKSDAIAKDVTHAGYHLLGQNSSIAIIGSGGGRDVVGAKNFNLSGIRAIEINPLVIEAVLLFSPKTYEGVDLTVADGREALAKSQRKFDLIQLSLVDSWAAVSSGSHALTENYLYTSEAFDAYLESVDEDGIVSVTYWNPYMDKLISLAFTSLIKAGADDPSRHVVIFKQGDVFTILTKKAPWSGQDIALARVLAEKNGYELVLPDDKPPGPVTTDDSPFFFFNSEGLNLLLAMIVIASLLFLLVINHLSSTVRYHNTTLAYFALIGFGYMAVESIFVQKFLLLIHDPTITVSVIFTSFLVFSGIGSILSKRISINYSILLVPLLIAFILAWHGFSAFLNGESIFVKALVSALAIAPFAILMGTFFPKGLAYLKASKLDEAGVAWSINGISSVLSPIIAILIAVHSNFSAILALAAVAYLASWLLCRKKFQK